MVYLKVYSVKRHVTHDKFEYGPLALVGRHAAVVGKLRWSAAEPTGGRRSRAPHIFRANGKRGPALVRRGADTTTALPSRCPLRGGRARVLRDRESTSVQCATSRALRNAAKALRID